MPYEFDSVVFPRSTLHKTRKKIMIETAKATLTKIFRPVVTAGFLRFMAA